VESAFAWLNQIFQAIYQFFPRILIVRATHGGVKWVRGKRVVALQPGLHVYWPLTTDVEVIVTARQTLSIPDQYMITKDWKTVGFKTLVVYRIPDVERAIGRNNWDVDTTINDLTQAAVARVIVTHTCEEILAAQANGSLAHMCTKEVRRELRQYGVYISRCKLVDFAPTKVIRLLTSASDRQGLSTSQFYN
jgi:regulator of protease activity HflC (stomatin/prohibitin superfamily)